MAKKENVLSLEILQRLEAGTFDPWERKNLRRISIFPWKEKEILPVGRAASGNSHICEIMGLSGAGKSTAVRYLQQNFDATRVRATVIPEFGSRGQSVNPISGDLELSQHREIRTILGLEAENLLLETLKIVSFYEALEANLDYLYQDYQSQRKGPPVLSVIERGTNDVLATMSWVASLALTKQTLPESMEEDIMVGELTCDPNKYVYPGYGKGLTEIFLKALTLSQLSVDAVAFWGVSRESVKSRRIAAGKEAEGPIVNDNNRQRTEHSYGWWLGSIYPILRKRHGTGLIVLDGDRPQEENNERLLEYFYKVAKVR